MINSTNVLLPRTLPRPLGRQLPHLKRVRGVRVQVQTGAVENIRLALEYHLACLWVYPVDVDAAAGFVDDGDGSFVWCCGGGFEGGEEEGGEDKEGHGERSSSTVHVE